MNQHDRVTQGRVMHVSEVLNTPSMEKLLRSNTLQSARDYVGEHAVIGNVEYTGDQGQRLTRTQWHYKMKRNRVLWDRLTLEMCDYLREQGERLEQWLLDAEYDAWQRTRFRRDAT